MNKKGFTIVELLAVIVVMAVIIILATSGYRNVSQKIKETSYKNKVSYIETSAANYTSETGFTVTNVDNLVKLGYVSADDEEGHVIDPRDGSYMNCHIVNVSKEENNYYGHYTENEECDINNIELINIHLGINIYKTSDNSKVESGIWTNSNVILEVYFKDETIKKEEVKKIKWTSNIGVEEREVANNFEIQNKYLVEAEQIVNTTYYVEVTLENGTVYQAQTNIKIDKQRPTIYEDEMRIEKESEYTSKEKEVTISATDGNGSGIYGYYIGASDKCNEVSYEENNDNIYTKELDEGTYYVCVKDQVGNVSEEISTKKIEIKYIDREAPKIKVKNDPLSLGTQDYEFRSNIEVEWSISGEGKVSCNPSISKKTGTYEVTCTAIGNNGLSSSITFTARHSYAATPYDCNCNCRDDRGCHCGTYTCDPWSCLCGAWPSGCCKQYFNAQCCLCDETTITVCDTCTCYSCPNGGTLSGTTCNY